MSKKYRIDILERKDDIEKWIKDSCSLSFMCQQLKCRYGTLHNYLKKLCISYSGNQGSRGKIRLNLRRNIEWFLKKNGPFINSHNLKLMLYRDGVKEKKCEVCNIEDWLGKELSFELDHIDGDRNNNRLENLRIICPNCHSQTPTNSGKANKKNKCPSSPTAEATDLESVR